MSRIGTSRPVAALAFLIAWNYSGAQMDEATKKSLDYVKNLQVDCVLDHGYQCMDIKEDDFLRPDSDKKMIPGVFLQAWEVSYADFKTIAELTDEQKELKHYKIGFTQNDDNFIVLFQGLLLPEIVDGVPSGIIRSTFGLSTKYWVDRRTLKINKRLFLR